MQLITKVYQRDIYTAHNTEAEIFEAGKQVQLEADQAEIPEIKREAYREVFEKIDENSAIEQLPYRDGRNLIRTIPDCTYQALKKREGVK